MSENTMDLGNGATLRGPPADLEAFWRAKATERGLDPDAFAARRWKEVEEDVSVYGMAFSSRRTGERVEPSAVKGREAGPL